MSRKLFAAGVIALALIVSVHCPALAAWALVQTDAGISGTVTGGTSTIAVTLNAPVGSGHCLVVAGSTLAVTAPTGVTDDKSNTYVAGPSIGASVGLGLFTLGNITNGPQTITISGTSLFYVHIYEFSGCLLSSSLTDGSGASASGVAFTGTDSVTTGALTTTVDGDLIVAFEEQTSGNATPTAGTGFTGATSLNSSFTSPICAYNPAAFVCANFGMGEYMTQTTHGSTTPATFSLGNNATTGQIAVALKPAASSTVVPAPIPFSQPFTHP